MRRTLLAMVLGAVSGVTLAGEVTVLTADRIHTSDPQRPRVQAMAWDEDGRLLELGEAAALLA